MGFSDGSWYMGISGYSIPYVVCCHRMCILNTSFACLFWLANNKEGKYPQLYIRYFDGDGTWFVGSGKQKYYSHGLLPPNTNI